DRRRDDIRLRPDLPGPRPGGFVRGASGEPGGEAPPVLVRRVLVAQQDEPVEGFLDQRIRRGQRIRWVFLHGVYHSARVSARVSAGAVKPNRRTPPALEGELSPAMTCSSLCKTNERGNAVTTRRLFLRSRRPSPARASTRPSPCAP